MNASEDPVQQIVALTAGRSVDVAVELIGLPETMEQSLRSPAGMGRTALVGITNRPLPFILYTESVGKETQIIGVAAGDWLSIRQGRAEPHGAYPAIFPSSGKHTIHTIEYTAIHGEGYAVSAPARNGSQGRIRSFP